MVKVQKKDKELVKWKKKKWYPILAPNIFNNQVLGETTIFEPSKVIGKAIRVNLMNLTGEVRNQNININFRVTGIKDDKAVTELIGYTLSPSFIKRVIRRKHTRVDATFVLKTRDNKKIVVKPMLITRNNVNKSVATSLRKNALDVLTGIVSGLSGEDFLKDMIHYKVQGELKRRLAKTYPMKTCEIKKMELVRDKEVR